jgi:hypothetical protein
VVLEVYICGTRVVLCTFLRCKMSFGLFSQKPRFNAHALKAENRRLLTPIPIRHLLFCQYLRSSDSGSVISNFRSDLGVFALHTLSVNSSKCFFNWFKVQTESYENTHILRGAIVSDMILFQLEPCARSVGNCTIFLEKFGRNSRNTIKNRR